MNKKFLIVLSVCLGLIVLMVIMFKLLAHPRFEAELNLTKEQKQQMRALKLDERKNFKNNFAEIKKLHAQLDEEFLKDTPDELKIGEIIAQIKNKHLEAVTGHFEGMLKIRKILTKDQFEKMVKSHQKFNKKWDHKGKFRGPGREPREGGMPPPPPF